MPSTDTPELLQICKAVRLALTDPDKARSYIKPLLPRLKQRSSVFSQWDVVWAAMAYAGMWSEIRENLELLKNRCLLYLLGDAASRYIDRLVQPEFHPVLSALWLYLPASTYWKVRKVLPQIAEWMLQRSRLESDPAWLRVWFKLLDPEREDLQTVRMVVSRLRDAPPSAAIPKLLKMLQCLPDQLDGYDLRPEVLNTLCHLADNATPRLRRKLFADPVFQKAWKNVRFIIPFTDRRILADLPFDLLMHTVTTDAINSLFVVESLRYRNDEEIKALIHAMLLRSAKPQSYIWDLLSRVQDPSWHRVLLAGMNLVLGDKRVFEKCRQTLGLEREEDYGHS